MTVLGDLIIVKIAKKHCLMERNWQFSLPANVGFQLKSLWIGNVQSQIRLLCILEVEHSRFLWLFL